MKLARVLGIFLALLSVSGYAAAEGVRVVENPEQFEPFPNWGLWRSYEVYNETDAWESPINVVAVVVTNSFPGTEWIRGEWNSVELWDESQWDLPMADYAGQNLTFREFFGGADYPGPSNAYWSDYTLDEGLVTFAENLIGPGESSVGQLWFVGPVESEFLVAGIPSTQEGAIDPSSFQIISGTAIVPEPATWLLLATGMCAVAIGRRGPWRC